MTERTRFRQRTVRTRGVYGGVGDGMSVDEMMDALYRVLRRHPAAMAEVEVEEVFLAMAKEEMACVEPS